MDQGDRAYAEKRFADALRAYRDADAIMHVPTTAGYYVVAGVPSTTATETGERGELGFFNVPPGQASVTVAVPSSGLSLGTRNLPVAPGTITMSGFGPRL